MSFYKSWSGWKQEMMGRIRMEAECPYIALPFWGPTPEMAKVHPCLELPPRLPALS